MKQSLENLKTIELQQWNVVVVVEVVVVVVYLQNFKIEAMKK